MVVPYESFEDVVITKMTIEKYLKEFEPEIRNILYNHFGKNLENIQEALLVNYPKFEFGLERLLELHSVNQQKAILMRFGIVTGQPMTLEDVSNELKITRERVRQIESKFLRVSRPLKRRKQLLDFLND